MSIDTLWDGCPSRSFNIKAHFMKRGVVLEGRRISQSGGLIILWSTFWWRQIGNKQLSNTKLAFLGWSKKHWKVGGCWLITVFQWGRMGSESHLSSQLQSSSSSSSENVVVEECNLCSDWYKFRVRAASVRLINTPTRHTTAMMKKASLKQWAPKHVVSAAAAAFCRNEFVKVNLEKEEEEEEKLRTAVASFVNKTVFPMYVSFWHSWS